MKQTTPPTLFGNDAPQLTPPPSYSTDPRTLARRDHPATSHEAAVEITEDGTQSHMKQVTRDALAKYPGRTAKELELLAGYSDGAIRKRLNDLRTIGEAVNGEDKVCSITGKSAQTWWPVKAI